MITAMILGFLKGLGVENKELPDWFPTTHLAAGWRDSSPNWRKH